MVIVRSFAAFIRVKQLAVLEFLGWFAGLLVVRLVASLSLACLTTISLLFFMQSLIATGEQSNYTPNIIKIVDATMPEFELEVIIENERPVQIELPDKPPPGSHQRQLKMDASPGLNVSREVVSLLSNIEIENASISVADGDMVPLVAIGPYYPERALRRDTEGWCLVHFTVSAIGSVIEETVEVVDSEPQNIFDNSCRNAVVRFKFQPRVIDGQGVDVPKVPYLFVFELTDPVLRDYLEVSSGH